MSAMPPIPAIPANPAVHSIHKQPTPAGTPVSVQVRQIARDIVRGLSREKPTSSDPSNLHPSVGPVHRMRRTSTTGQSGKNAFLDELGHQDRGKTSAQESQEQEMRGTLQRVATHERIAQRQAAVRERAINATRFEIQPATFAKAASQLKAIFPMPAGQPKAHSHALAFLAELEALARRAYYYDQALRVQLHNDPRPWWFRAVHIEEESMDEWVFRLANTQDEPSLENSPKTWLVIHLARLDSQAQAGLSTRTLDIDLERLPWPPVPAARYNEQATHYGLQLHIPVKTDAGAPVPNNPVPLAIDYDVHLADQTHLPMWPFDHEGRFNPAHDGQPGTDNAPWVRPAKALDWQYLLEQSFGRQRLWAQHACANHAFEHSLTALVRQLGQVQHPRHPLISQGDDYVHHKFLELQRHKAEQNILPHSHFERLIELPCRWGGEHNTLRTQLLQAAARNACNGWLGTGDRLQAVKPSPKTQPRNA